MGVVDNNHFTAYSYTHGSTYLEFGDSLHNSPPSDLLTIFNWAFGDVIPSAVTEIRRGDIGLQGGLNGGEGSCALAALDFTEAAASPGIARWNGAHSEDFRNRALEDLVSFHHYALRTEGGFPDWVQIVLSAMHIASNNTTPANLKSWGYRDCNIYEPQANHPIHLLHPIPSEVPPKLPVATPPTQAVPRLPLIGQLSSTSLSIPTDLRAPGGVLNQDVLLPAISIKSEPQVTARPFGPPPPPRSNPIFSSPHVLATNAKLKGLRP